MNEETVAAQPMRELDRLAGVLFDPRPAFVDIAARPRWWVPLVLLTLLIVGFILAFTQHVGWERFMRQQIESNPRARELPAEQKERIIEQQLRFVPYFAHLQGALAWGVIALATAGAFVFVFNVLLGTQMLFRQVFAVTCYSFLPHALGILLAAVVLFIKDPADFDLQNPVASNLGAFLDPGSVPAWLVSLGKSIDLFNLWNLLLLATGFSAAARKLDWSKALTWLLLTWGVWLGAKSLWVWIWS